MQACGLRFWKKWISENKVASGDFFTKHQSLSIWCLIFVVFNSFYRLLKIWPHAWYLPIQAVWLNILFISLLGFFKEREKSSLKAEECLGLEDEQWFANTSHFDTCSRSLTSLCVSVISIHLLFRQLPEYMFICTQKRKPSHKMWHLWKIQDYELE